MKYKIIKSSEVESIDKGFIKIKQLLNEKGIAGLSVSIVEIDGINKKIINTKSDATYFVIEGNGFFNIDEEEVEVNIGDLIFIPKGLAYFDKGSLKMLAINSPRYEQSKIKYLN